MPCRLARPARPRRKPGALILSLVGSALGHAALALALACQTVEPAAAAREPRSAHVGPSPFTARMDDLWWWRWPPLPAPQACFERETLEPLGYRLSQVDAYGYRADQLSSWTSFESLGRHDEEDSGAYLRGSVEECAGAAKSEGWSGRGRVHVRVQRGGDGRVRAQAWPLDDEANVPRLLCCLRESQESLAARVPRNGELRYVMDFGAKGVALKPNPLRRPIEAYQPLTCPGACDF